MQSKFTRRHSERGAVLIIAMVFVLLFSTLAVSLCSIASSNTQIAGNQRKVNSALYAAQSGLECAKRIALTTNIGISTASNQVTEAQANTAWTNFCSSVPALDGQAFGSITAFTDTDGRSGQEIVTGPINFGATNVTFRLRFFRYDDEPMVIMFESVGSNNEITRTIQMDMAITKENSVMQYAIASRGRMWVTGDSTIDGDIYSSWDRPELSPFDITADSRIEGTINTVLTKEEIESDHPYPYDDYQFEDINDPDCVIRGYNEGINYGVHDQTAMPGMEISDYDTDGYDSSLYTLPYSGTVIREYFPHAPSDLGGYTQPRDYGSVALNRNVYDGMTLNNVKVAYSRNALFRNCTFEGVLYIDCYKSGTSYYNNIRFEDCTFNGIIVTDVPQVLNWQRNCLYFTGGATFNNESAYQEATILAPHFNVNLGNTNPEQSDNNVLTGAIVGGIVDIRGNAQINGTVISMCDTTIYSSGYVTNIGATLGDGGSETTELGDIGTIGITPNPDQLLPSGITTPIVIKPDLKTYSEGV
ncbi:MAG: pilus assembly PilX N-terminal domain-containing protein [Phycisphaerae bacterium]